jgi:DNA-binding response OmpR family regulator
MENVSDVGEVIDPTLSAIAVRLADEGIPVRAIARGTKLPSEDVYEVLRGAMEIGSIVELPKDDWPAGSNRDQRSRLHNTLLEQEETLRFACTRFFKATKLQATLLSTLLRRNEATKSQLHLVLEQNRPGDNHANATDPKIVDVLICHLRKKLAPYDVKIETVWGTGYLISAPHRERAIALLENFCSSVPTAAVN